MRVVRVVSRVVHAKRGFFLIKSWLFWIFEKKSSPQAVPCSFDRLPKNRESREIWGSLFYFRYPIFSIFKIFLLALIFNKYLTHSFTYPRSACSFLSSYSIVVQVSMFTSSSYPPKCLECPFTCFLKVMRPANISLIATSLLAKLH